MDDAIAVDLERSAEFALAEFVFLETGKIEGVVKTVLHQVREVEGAAAGGIN